MQGQISVSAPNGSMSLVGPGLKDVLAFRCISPIQVCTYACVRMCVYESECAFGSNQNIIKSKHLY